MTYTTRDGQRIATIHTKNSVKLKVTLTNGVTYEVSSRNLSYISPEKPHFLDLVKVNKSLFERASDFFDKVLF